MAHRIRDILLVFQQWFSSAKKGNKAVAEDIDASGLASEAGHDRAHTVAKLGLCHRKAVLSAKEPATGVQFEPITKDDFQPRGDD